MHISYCMGLLFKYQNKIFKPRDAQKLIMKYLNFVKGIRNCIYILIMKCYKQATFISISCLGGNTFCCIVQRVQETKRQGTLKHICKNTSINHFCSIKKMTYINYSVTQYKFYFHPE